MNKPAICVFVAALAAVLFGCGGSTESVGSTGVPDPHGSGGSAGQNGQAGAAGTGGSTALPQLVVKGSAPQAFTVSPGDTLVDMGQFGFTAQGGDIPFKSVRFTLSGVNVASDIVAVRISGDALPLAASPVKSFDSASNSVSFDTGFTLPDGVSTYATAMVDFSPAAVPGSTYQISIMTANDVEVDSATVSGAFPIQGYLYTMSGYAKFSMNLATNVQSSTYVAGQADVGAVAITVSASDDEIDFDQLVLQGQASIASEGCILGEPCTGQAAARRIASATLFEGSTQIGSPVVPDPQTGKFVFTNLGLAVPPMTTKALTVKMTLASTVSQTAPYDQVAVGVTGDFVATSPVGLPVAAAGYGNHLLDQTGPAPSVVHTITPN